MSAMPKLRFAEFDKSWDSSQLHSAIASLDAGVSVNSGDRAAGEEELGILKTSCVTFGTFNPKENKVVYEQSEIIRLKEPVSKNSIIISRMNTPKLVGANALVTDHFSNLFLPDRLWAAKLKASVDPVFISVLLGESRTRAAISARATGTSGSMKNITKGDVLTLPVKLPSLPEQKKIADFLGAVDDKIAALRKRECLLTDYKKGAMQKIFTQALRFKAEDGSDFPDWKPYILSSIAESIGGLSGKSGDDFGSGKAFYITYKQIFDNSKIDVSRLEKVHINLGERQNLIQYGDVLFTTSSETPSEVAFASVVLNTLSNVFLNSFSFALRPYSLEELNPQFSQFLFRSVGFRKLVFPLAQGSTRYNISKTNFMKLSISLPHPDEQQKIADFLSAIDDKITAVSAQITQMQDFKKGLLQQMLV